MKLAVISDVHFPIEISRNTILYGSCGYTDDFYIHLKQDLTSFTSKDIDVFILCGDFYWDFIYFSRYPNWDFNDHIYKLQEFRSWLDPEIPMVLIEGNHDVWLDSYIYTEEGITYFNREEFEDHLFEYYYLSDGKVEEIMNNLQMSENVTEIGKNLHILRKNGLMVKDVFIYGFPYYDKKELNMAWSKFKEELIQDFNKKVEEQTMIVENTTFKTVLCHHSHPPALKFVQDLNNPSCDIKAFFWGHFHLVPPEYIQKLGNHGPYYCVMPEMNNHRIQIYEF